MVKQRRNRPFVGTTDERATTRRQQKALHDLENRSVNTAKSLEYSLKETETGKTWLGKKVFRKVINVAPLPNATSKTVPHSVEKLADIIGFSGFGSNGSVYIPLPYTHQSSSHIRVSGDKTDITLNTGTDFSTYDVAYVVIEYTKTNEG